MEAELDVSVVEHVPFCKTIGDELTDVLHHERFGGISVKEPSDCVRHGLCAAKRRVFASKSPSKTVA
jgi:hypothetical protein